MASSKPQKHDAPQLFSIAVIGYIGFKIRERLTLPIMTVILDSFFQGLSHYFTVWLCWIDYGFVPQRLLPK